MEKSLLSNLKNRKSVIAGLLILWTFLLTLAAGLGVGEDFLVQPEQDILYKIRFLLRGHRPPSPHIVLLPVNDRFIEEKKISFWDRDLYARFIDSLVLHQAVIIACDIFFPEKFPEPLHSRKDSGLLNAVRNAGTVYYPVYLENRGADSNTGMFDDLIRYPEIINPGKVPIMDTIQGSFEELHNSARGSGCINLNPDTDGKSRKFPLLFQYKEGYIFSYPLALVCHYLNIKPENVQLDAGKALTLKGAVLYDSIRRDIKIPIDEHGNMFINYPGPWQDSCFCLDPSRLYESSGRREGDIFKLVNGSITVISDLTTRGFLTHPPLPEQSLLR